MPAIARAVSHLDQGEVLEVLSSDPHSVLVLLAWTDVSGNPLLDVRLDDDYRFEIQRGGGPVGAAPNRAFGAPGWSRNMTMQCSDQGRTLVLLRHGESTWNRENRFSGWTDVDLTDQGIAEAHDAAQRLREVDLRFDVAFTSVLTRAIRTLWIVLDDLGLMWIPVQRSWRLNERHYGALQGLSKSETADRLGEALVHTWRRSYGVRPPALEPGDDRAPAQDERYAHIAADLLPHCESLADTVERVLPYWDAKIAPQLDAGRRILLVAHGNSLRALVKHLDHMDDDAIAGLNIPTGMPLLYRLDTSLRPIEHRYLGDPAAIAAAQAAVAAQGRARA